MAEETAPPEEATDEPELANLQSQEEHFLHYTDEKGWQGISSSGLIRAHKKKVFVTQQQLDPQTVEQAVFAGNSAYAGRGAYVIIFTVREGVVFQPGTQPNELVHFGSLRDGRHIDIVYSGPNQFT
jgi:hypothetical protein